MPHVSRKGRCITAWNQCRPCDVPAVHSLHSRFPPTNNDTQHFRSAIRQASALPVSTVPFTTLGLLRPIIELPCDRSHTNISFEHHTDSRSPLWLPSSLVCSTPTLTARSRSTIEEDQGPPWYPPLPRPACPWSAHQDHWSPWPHRCQQEEVNGVPIDKMHLALSGSFVLSLNAAFFHYQPRPCLAHPSSWCCNISVSHRLAPSSVGAAWRVLPSCLAACQRDETARFYCAREVGLQAIHLWPESFNNAAAGCSESRTRAHGCRLEIWTLWPGHAESAVFLLGAPDDDALRLEKDPSPSKAEEKCATSKREGQGRRSCIFKVTQASAFAFPSEAALGESKKKKEKKKKDPIKISSDSWASWLPGSSQLLNPVIGPSENWRGWSTVLTELFGSAIFCHTRAHFATRAKASSAVTGSAQAHPPPPSVAPHHPYTHLLSSGETRLPCEERAVQDLRSLTTSADLPDRVGTPGFASSIEVQACRTSNRQLRRSSFRAAHRVRTAAALFIKPHGRVDNPRQPPHSSCSLPSAASQGIQSLETLSSHRSASFCDVSTTPAPTTHAHHATASASAQLTGTMSDRAVPAMEEEVDYEGLGSNVPLHINMIAGSLAGISEHAVMFPVDVIRTRMQVLSATPAATYTGVVQAFNRISTLEGARTLWRGVASVIMGAGPAHAVYFGTYETVKEATGGNREGHQFATHADARLAAPHRHAVRLHGVQAGGPARILRLVPHHAHHDRAFHSSPVLRLRMGKEGAQPVRGLLAAHARLGRCLLGCRGCRGDQPIGRGQDAAPDPRQQHRCADPQRLGHVRGVQDHQRPRGPQGFRAWSLTARAHLHAVQRTLLALLRGLPILPQRAEQGFRLSRPSGIVATTKLHRLLARQARRCTFPTARVILHHPSSHSQPERNHICCFVPKKVSASESLSFPSASSVSSDGDGSFVMHTNT
ncbi:hypothetical protein L1887_57142 [Cichorium endivia]|nr:hypothetical protein L1887_57142 [Cichorium endivia]